MDSRNCQTLPVPRQSRRFSCLNKIKYYRRIFSRFEKLARNYMGFLRFASALIWLR